MVYSQQLAYKPVMLFYDFFSSKMIYGIYANQSVSG